MSDKDTGGPAFPQVGWDSTDCRNFSTGGMTLRDYFAIHASESDLQQFLDEGFTRALARYKHADVMLKARQQ